VRLAVLHHDHPRRPQPSPDDPPGRVVGGVQGIGFGEGAQLAVQGDLIVVDDIQPLHGIFPGIVRSDRFTGIIFENTDEFKTATL
jgi:hypothetical protein